MGESCRNSRDAEMRVATMAQHICMIKIVSLCEKSASGTVESIMEAFWLEWRANASRLGRAIARENPWASSK